MNRVKELITRQVYYGSSLICKLKKKEGIFHYEISLWTNQGNIDNKSVIKTGIYNSEDPEELFKQITNEIGKYKLGKRKEIIH